MLIKLIFLTLIVLWYSAVQDGLAHSGDDGKVIGSPHIYLFPILSLHNSEVSKI